MGSATVSTSFELEARAVSTLPYLGLGLSSNAQLNDAPHPYALLDAHPGLFDYVEYSAPLDVAEARAQASLFAEMEKRLATTPLVYHPVHLNLFGAELESLVTNEATSPRLDRASRDRLVANLPWYRESIAQLQAGPVPETLVHGDFHPWNVHRDGDHLVIFDWSDAAITKPFVDVMTWATWLAHDPRARDALWQSFGDVWADVLPPTCVSQT